MPFALPIGLALGLICFLLMHATPGEPATRFAHWLGRALQGDLGISRVSGRPVAQELTVALKNSLVLALAAALIGALAGTLLGLHSAAHRSRWPYRMASALAVLGVSLPHCWLGLALVAAFSASLGWLPALDGGWLLPALALGVVPAGSATRAVQAAARESVARHCAPPPHGALQMLKDTVPAALAAAGTPPSQLLVGAMLLEAVFHWPGAGQLLHAAIFQRDVPVLQGTLAVLGLVFVLFRWAPKPAKRP